MEKHTDCEVLEATSRTLHMLCSPELAFYSRADFARSRLVDHLADKFQHEETELFQVQSTGGCGSLEWSVGR